MSFANKRVSGQPKKIMKYFAWRDISPFSGRAGFVIKDSEGVGQTDKMKVFCCGYARFNLLVWLAKYIDV